jgi:hypothetical protein
MANVWWLNFMPLPTRGEEKKRTLGNPHLGVFSP